LVPPMSPTKTVCAAARGATAYLARVLALAWRLAATAFLMTRTEEVTLRSREREGGTEVRRVVRF
jgi:hypothetical protein